MVAVSGGVPAGRSAGLGPHRHLLWGLASGTMSTYVPAAPWTLESSPEQGGTLQEGPSFHQPPYAHPTFSSQKTTQPAPRRRASPARGRAPESHHLAGEPAAACVHVRVSDFCLCSHPHPFCKGFAGAILSLRGLHSTAPPSRPQECERALWAPLLVRSVGDSFPACALSWGRLFPFLGRDTGSPLGKVPGPSSQAE